METCCLNHCFIEISNLIAEDTYLDLGLKPMKPSTSLLKTFSLSSEPFLKPVKCQPHLRIVPSLAACLRYCISLHDPYTSNSPRICTSISVQMRLTLLHLSSKLLASLRNCFWSPLIANLIFKLCHLLLFAFAIVFRFKTPKHRNNNALRALKHFKQKSLLRWYLRPTIWILL